MYNKCHGDVRYNMATVAENTVSRIWKLLEKRILKVLITRKKKNCIYVWCSCAGLSPFSPVWLFSTLWTVAHQAPLSMEFSRQKYWSGLSCLSPGDLPDPGIKPVSPALQVDSLPLSHWGSPCVCWSVLLRLTVMVILQYVQIPNHYVVYLKRICNM